MLVVAHWWKGTDAERARVGVRVLDEYVGDTGTNSMRLASGDEQGTSRHLDGKIVAELLPVICVGILLRFFENLVQVEISFGVPDEELLSPA